MKVEIEKRRDGASVLRCTRSDGSVTWQKTGSRHGGFFPLHDLVHFGVETVLGARNAFFGLIEQGWDIEDTTGKGARGPLPREALDVELIVALLSSEAASGQLWSAEEFHEQARLFAASQQSQTIEVQLDDQRLAAIRSGVRELHARWMAVGPGDRLTLEFMSR